MLFQAVLDEICSGRVQEPFRAEDVSHVLPDPQFLHGHAIDDKHPKPMKGQPYFIRVASGQFRINPDFRNCE
jgi:hypothetical protein